MDYMGNWENKDPDEIRRVGIDWSSDLGPGDKITSSTWTVVSGSVSLVDGPGGDHDDTVCGIKVSGGTNGESAKVKNHSVTLNGEHLEGTMRMDIRTR